VAPREFTREATAQGYFPEWVSAGATLTDTTAFARTYDQEQWQHAIGVTNMPVRVAPDVAGTAFLYEWFTGEPPPADASINVDAPAATVFYAVLQGVGPDLTTENWSAGLTEAPPAATGGLSLASLSWGAETPSDGYDYHGVDDATLIWWDPDATGPDELNQEGTGMYRFVDGGARYLPDEWPTNDELFDESSSVTLYAEPPPGEEVPDFPVVRR
jgi:hypothetical protein